MPAMDRTRFERLVEEALASLPPDFRERLENVAMIVERAPSPRAARRHGRRGQLLLGLYEGRPLTERDSRDAAAFPDTITIYQANVEAVCASEAEIREEVRRTVLHEVAHHFGIDDERLHDLGY